ncbi:DUF4148 domain-containing protein [Paraburkholderia saeva]|uniref:DUF4148 domain-containing protein n=1 Tax=Paraburkholderia saeva TaxID=2777537 RepID=UPI001E096FF0|nr:DUF4148 domain-containing protein [Paraburkholderia saeva]CAG4906637.1 hypothetical protein R70241_03440 [Paraburkholderia saeva]
MKRAIRISSGVLVGALCVGSAFAQSPSSPYDPSGPLTRAQVSADLVAWRAAGFSPLETVDYPRNAIRAGNIVAAQRAQTAGFSNAQ